MNDVMCIRININILECSEGEVQLVDGGKEYEGRVEVCDGGEWKTVCDRMWLEEEAKVNYSNPSST